VLNPAPALGLDRETFGLADIVTPNRNELAVLSAAEVRRTARRSGGDDPARLARALLATGTGGVGVREAVIVTLGEHGALLVPASSPDRPTELPAHRVEPIDTTGAGDAFNGALAAALAEGRDLEEAAARAIVAGGLATTKAGAREGMPTTTELWGALERAATGRPGTGAGEGEAAKGEPAADGEGGANGDGGADDGGADATGGGRAG
jgi:ribokinase